MTLHLCVRHRSQHQISAHANVLQFGRLTHAQSHEFKQNMQHTTWNQNGIALERTLFLFFPSSPYLFRSHSAPLFPNLTGLWLMVGLKDLRV